MTIDQQYIGAYKVAPEETRKMIERYMAQPKEYRGKHPLLYFILGSGTQPYKMSKTGAEYRGESESRHECGNCVYAFQKVKAKRFICSQIQGDIKLNGICKLWRG